MINAAFLTADIARSTEFFSSEEMKELASEIKALLTGENCIFSFNRFDAFQILHREPASSLELALKIRLTVKKFSIKRPDVRICLGLGYADPEITDFTFLKDRLFVLTGRAFDQMEKERQWFRIILSEPGDAAFQPGFSAIGIFPDYLIRKLTFKQAGILADLMNDYSQKEISIRQEKSLPTINKQVKASSWDNFREILRLYRALLQNMKHDAL
jgi:hypothetical protein